jgi:uncharacterized protein YdeI (YjbR/CyaY-like superfamily)
MPGTSAATPLYFATPAAFRSWLERHHEQSRELWVGFHKRGTGRPSLTWPESVDEALCFGWIDGVRKRVDADSYTIRFTPRRPESIWSEVNTRRMAELIAAKRVRPAGLTAFEHRTEARTAIYAYEQRKTAELPPELEARFRSKKRAWAFYQAQAPWYRRTTAWWVISAKREETRLKRLTMLIDCSAQGEPIAGLDRTRASGG